MLEHILRPVALPNHLIGKPAPCDFFDVRGRLLLRRGSEISEQTCRVSRAGESRRLFCDAENAERLWPVDPIGQIDQILQALVNVERRVVRGDSVPAGVFFGLTKTLLNNWRVDADACLGYARMLRGEHPTAEHALLAALFAAELASASGLSADEIANLTGAALTMNLGSFALHDMLAQRIGAPSHEEREAIHAHPVRAAALLVRLGEFPQAWREAVLQHHENIDGSGYPMSLSGGEISLFGRILRTVDIFSARLRGRRGRSPQYWNMKQAESVSKLITHIFGRDLGRRVDITLARLLIQRIGVFSPGSLVRLNNGEFAIVTRRVGNPEEAPEEVISFAFARGENGAIRPQPRRIGGRGWRILGFAHDDQPSLPECDWPVLWGYRGRSATASARSEAREKQRWAA